MGLMSGISRCGITHSEMGCDGRELWNSRDRRLCHSGNLTAGYAGSAEWPTAFDQPKLFFHRLVAALRWPDRTGKVRPDERWSNVLQRVIFLNDSVPGLQERDGFPVFPGRPVSGHFSRGEIVLTHVRAVSGNYSRSTQSQKQRRLGKRKWDFRLLAKQQPSWRVRFSPVASLRRATWLIRRRSPQPSYTGMLAGTDGGANGPV
jgi:hypothetical protein